MKGKKLREEPKKNSSKRKNSTRGPEKREEYLKV